MFLMWSFRWRTCMFRLFCLMDESNLFVLLYKRPSTLPFEPVRSLLRSKKRTSGLVFRYHFCFDTYRPSWTRQKCGFSISCSFQLAHAKSIHSSVTTRHHCFYSELPQHYSFWFYFLFSIKLSYATINKLQKLWQNQVEATNLALITAVFLKSYESFNEKSNFNV